MSALTRLRVAGFVATLLLAVSAVAAGAQPTGDPAPDLLQHWQAEPSFWLAAAAWLVGAALLVAVWWHGRRLATPMTSRQILTTGAVWALPLLLVAPLASSDIYTYACQGAGYAGGHDPYAGGVAESGCAWLAAVPELWHHSPTPYGPLAVLVSGGAAGLAGDRLWLAVGLLRVAAVGGLALAAYTGMKLARTCGADPSVALWAGLVTPLVLLHGISGGHNDTLVAGLVVAALALAARGRAGGAALVAAAVAVKVTAIVALPFVLLLAWKHQGALARRWRVLAAESASAVAAFALLTWASGLGFGWARALTGTQELAQWSSIPTGAGMAIGYVLRAFGEPGAAPTAIAVARLVGVAALAVIGIVALRRSWRAPVAAVVVACGWVMAATALLGPVFYAWYAIPPLAVLAFAGAGWARTRAVVTVALVFLVLPNGLGVPVLTKGPGAFAVFIGLMVVAWTAWRSRRGGRSTPTATG